MGTISRLFREAKFEDVVEKAQRFDSEYCFHILKGSSYKDEYCSEAKLLRARAEHNLQGPCAAMKTYMGLIELYPHRLEAKREFLELRRAWSEQMARPTRTFPVAVELRVRLPAKYEVVKTDLLTVDDKPIAPGKTIRLPTGCHVLTFKLALKQGADGVHLTLRHTLDVSEPVKVTVHVWEKSNSAEAFPLASRWDEQR